MQNNDNHDKDVKDFKFECFLEQCNDVIDNAAFNLLSILNGTIDWDMSLIGDLVDAAEEILRKNGYHPCHPFYEGDDRTPCVAGKDCNKRGCLFRALNNPRPAPGTKNTLIQYLYRDADNYKTFNSCVVRGAITQDQRDRIAKSLNDGEYFKPEMVGLPAKRFETFDPEADHDWMELLMDGFETTDDDASVDVDIEELTKRFEEAAAHNWES